MPSERKPTFFVVGAAKAGTTALYHYLRLHPDVFMCPIKEPQHFSTDIRFENYSAFQQKMHTRLNIAEYLKQPMLRDVHIDWVVGWENYLELFRDATTETAIGEISNAYLYSRVAAKNIAEKCPGARIIMILRDPIERAFSHHKMFLWGGFETERNFLRAVEKDFNCVSKGWGVSWLYIELGLYYEQVKRFTNMFAREQILIFSYDNWRRDNQRVLNRMFSFLGVETMSLSLQTQNAPKLTPRLPLLQLAIEITHLRYLQRRVLPEKLRAALKTLWYSKAEKGPTSDDRKHLLPYFADDIDKLERLTGMDLSSWKRCE